MFLAILAAAAPAAFVLAVVVSVAPALGTLAVLTTVTVALLIARDVRRITARS